MVVGDGERKPNEGRGGASGDESRRRRRGCGCERAVLCDGCAEAGRVGAAVEAAREGESDEVEARGAMRRANDGVAPLGSTEWRSRVSPGCTMHSCVT